jgi:AraC-like DNA-binding protein
MKLMPANDDRVMLDFARYGVAGIPLLGRYTYTCAHPPLRQHIHRNVFEVCVLQHGSQKYMIGKTRFELKAGDMIITRPGEAHGTDTEPENRGRLYWIQLVRPPPNRPFLGLPPAAARALFKALKDLHHRQYHNCDLLFGTFERILAWRGNDRPKALAKASAQNLLLRLTLDILSLTGRATHPACSPGIRRVLDYMDEHHAEPLSLARLSTVAGASESYIKTHFPREVGMTPMEHLMGLRIEKAKRALLESNSPITALALQQGFATSQHFATAFKRLTGLSPRDFRRKAGRARYVPAPPLEGTGPRFHPITFPKLERVLI